MRISDWSSDVCSSDLQSWTIMRFAEYENTAGDLEWLIRKDGCMHCEDPGCLKACPAPGAIVQYNNGIVDFHEENCIGCGRSEEHTSELQSLMRISYAVFCLKKKKTKQQTKKK